MPLRGVLLPLEVSGLRGFREADQVLGGGVVRGAIEETGTAKQAKGGGGECFAGAPGTRQARCWREKENSTTDAHGCTQITTAHDGAECGSGLALAGF